jgi:hypothetical protein
MPGVGNFEADRNWGKKTGQDLNYGDLRTPPPVVTAYTTYEAEAKELAKEYAVQIAEDLKRKNAPRQLKISPVLVQRGEDHIAALRKAVKSPSKPCMLICFLSEHRNKEFYGKIKEFCNKFGYISQCVNVGKQKNKNVSTKSTIVANIVKQVLNKYGILCWWADIKLCCPSLDRKTVMLIGIDVYHAKKKFIDQKKSLSAETIYRCFYRSHNRFQWKLPYFM